MQCNQDTIVFSTGKKVKTYRDIIGISISAPIDGSVSLYYGYDGIITTVLNDCYDKEYHEDALTKEECIELSNTMIEAWTRYRDSVEGET